MAARPAFAFLLAPIAPSLLDGVWQLVSSALDTDVPFQFSIPFSPPLVIASYLCAGLIGVPAYLMFRRYLGRTWWKYLISGSVIGCAPALLLAVLVDAGDDLGMGIAWIAGIIGLIYGAIAGFTFWLIGVARVSRPIRVD
jgi:membrane associated rhomboid family serine protease